MRENYNPKYAFYYFLSLVALIFMAVSVGLIAFGIINRTIADVLAIAAYNNFNNNFNGQFKFAISALFIATPVFYIISNLINRGLKREELKIDSEIRRWLTYFIIFVSSLIILGVFIGIINNFLSGELTTRFILKAASVFIIAAMVFSFYFYDIKRVDVVKKDKVVKMFFFASLTLVLVAFISAWFYVESPQEARNRRLDEIVVNNMYNLESAINAYYERHSVLPISLDDLKNEENFFFEDNFIFDPETQERIVYKLTGENNDSFELCANFRTNSFELSGSRATHYRGDKNHEAGYQCLAGQLWSREIIEPIEAAQPDVPIKAD